MGKLHLSIGTIALTAALAACDSEAATAPPPTPTPTTVTPSSAAPTPTPSASPTPPVMPAAAKAHTAAGAEAFVVYYWRVVDYAQRTLNTRPVEAVSAPACAGCRGGIDAMKQFAKQHAVLLGGSQTVTHLRSPAVQEHDSAVVTYVLSNERQVVKIPGHQTLIHPAGSSNQLMTLVPRPGGWLAAELSEVR